MWFFLYYIRAPMDDDAASAASGSTGKHPSNQKLKQKSYAHQSESPIYSIP